MTRNNIQNPDNPEEHNRNWQETHTLLSEAYIAIMKKEDRQPRIKELSEMAGVSEPNVQRHIKIIEKMSFKERFGDLKLLTKRILMAQGAFGATDKPGSTQAARLFLEIIEGLGVESKSDSRPLSNLTGEELENTISEMEALSSGKLVNFVRRTPGIRGASSGTNGKGV